MIVKLLTEHHFEFLNLKGGRTGLSEATLVKMPHCWKSRVMAQFNTLACGLMFNNSPVMPQPCSLQNSPWQHSEQTTMSDDCRFDVIDLRPLELHF